MHEASMHPENCFITLTYSDENLPANGSISVVEIQNFFKRLIDSLDGKKIRRFCCGEYGDETLRPHYHCLIFNHQFSDLKLHSTTHSKTNSLYPNKLYTSQQLSKLWPFGHSTTSQLTYQTAAYCARYILKKYAGTPKGDHELDPYIRPHPITGHLHRVEPEFATQSRRPGLGDAWFQKYKTDAFPSDFIVVDGKKHAVPKYYTLKLQEEELVKIKRRRKAISNKNRADNTPARLKVREAVQLSRATQLKRTLK